jgi:hypothetical protein
MNDTFVDKDGRQITKARYLELLADKGYSEIQTYRNAQIQACLHWDGQIENGKNIFPGEWKAFYVTMHDRTDTEWALNHGDSRRFVTEVEARIYYQRMLITYTQSCMIGDEFIEKGNLLRPGEIQVEEDQNLSGLFGSW